VSASPESQVNPNAVEETRRQINRLFEEVARLAEMDLPPNEFYAEFLKRLLMALGAPAGAVWGRTAQGNLQLQFQINMRQVGYDATDEGRESHDELLRQAVLNPRPLHLPPHSAGAPGEGGVAPGNPTAYLNLLVPVVVDNQVAGLLEVWHQPDRHPNAIPGFLQFMTRMAEMATRYARNQMLRQMVGQQQLWVQLEGFARDCHASLNPVEVAYRVANDGRRLIDCDRVSVGIRYGRKVTVEAISGADVVEKRSNLVVLMRKLFDAVIKWGEKLIYSGKKDDSLPPAVQKALDAYLAESNSKLLVVLPLRDEREGQDNKKVPRSAIIMECFEPAAAPEQLFARLEVIGRHASTALYNAVEHRRIPMRFVWMPIAAVQEGLGGKTQAIIYAISAGVVLLILALIFVPYPLKMDASGALQPEVRRWVYAPTKGKVVAISVEPNERVGPEQNLLLMHDHELEQRLAELDASLKTARGEFEVRSRQLGQNMPQAERLQIEGERRRAEATVQATSEQRTALLRRVNADENRRGFFWLKAPEFPRGLANVPENPQWTVLNADFREVLLDKEVKPDMPLLRLGEKKGPWEVELKIPQKHDGQVRAAFEYTKDKVTGEYKDLDVDLLVRAEPTRIYKGKLAFNKVTSEATPNRDDNNESEPVVYAYVRLEGDDIPAGYRLREETPRLLVSGSEVRAKIRCGDNYPSGYSLFYGVWEFFYEKVVFFF
jgi:hypothetical protein